MSIIKYDIDSRGRWAEYWGVSGFRYVEFNSIEGLRGELAAGRISLVAVCSLEMEELDFPSGPVISALTDGERSRLGTVRHPGARGRYLASRLLVKAVCAALGGTPAISVETAAGSGGRLVLNGPLARSHVSLSHTRGAAAFAISATAPIGVDIERFRRPPLAVAKKYFSAVELDAIESAESPSAGFFRLWTLKESLAKLEGKGILRVLREYEFSFADGQARCRNKTNGLPPPARFESAILGRYALGAAFGGADAQPVLAGPMDLGGLMRAARIL